MATATGVGDEPSENLTGWREVDIKVEGLGRKVFAADSMLTRLQSRIKGMLSKAAPDRGPDDYAPDDEERVTIPVRWLERALRPPSPGHGSVNGSSALSKILLGALITLNVAAIGWFASSLIEVRQDVAVIKCQLSPDCKKVLTSGSP